MKYMLCLINNTTNINKIINDSTMQRDDQSLKIDVARFKETVKVNLILIFFSLN